MKSQLCEKHGYTSLCYCKMPRDFEDGVLIFGPKRGEDRKVHNDEFHSMYSLPNIVRVIKSRMGWGGACGMQGGRERCL